MLQTQNLNPVYDNWEWQNEGKCVSMDTNIFFLEDNMRGRQKRNRERAAVDICRTCPVIQQCLNHALSVPEIYGVWGGMTSEQRMEILKRRKLN